MRTANKREKVSTVCLGAAASKASAKPKNLSADADIWKMPNIGRYIGRPLLIDIYTHFYLIAINLQLCAWKHYIQFAFKYIILK